MTRKETTSDLFLKSLGTKYLDIGKYPEANNETESHLHIHGMRDLHTHTQVGLNHHVSPGSASKHLIF